MQSFTENLHPFELGNSVCLLVEDNTVDRMMMTRAMRDAIEGVEIVECTTLDGAREYLKSNKPNMICVDNFLPDGMGMDLLREFSDDKRFSDIPLVVISGQSARYFKTEQDSFPKCSFISKDDVLKERMREIVTAYLADRGKTGANDAAEQLVENISVEIYEHLGAPLSRAIRKIRSAKSSHLHKDPEAVVELFDGLEDLLVAAREFARGHKPN